VFVLVFVFVLVSFHRYSLSPYARHAWTGGAAMENERIREAIERVAAFLRQHPEAGRSTDTFATAVIDEGLRVRVSGPLPIHVLTSDMPSALGGGASAPSPGWLLRATLAACDATVIAMRAAQEGVTLTRLEVTVSSESDDRGLLGTQDGVPAGPLTTSMRVRVAGDGVDEQRLRDIVSWARDHSPVDDALRRPAPIDVEVDVTTDGLEAPVQ